MFWFIQSWRKIWLSKIKNYNNREKDHSFTLPKSNSIHLVHQQCISFHCKLINQIEFFFKFLFISFGFLKEKLCCLSSISLNVIHLRLDRLFVCLFFFFYSRPFARWLVVDIYGGVLGQSRKKRNKQKKRRSESIQIG